jgi:alpha-tubulin suppressor-like RCC1 family protein
MSPASSVIGLTLLVTALLLSGCPSGDGGTARVQTQSASAVLNRSVTALAAGDGHACALDGRGAVACWGHNFSGQLGDGDRIDAFAPLAAGGWSANVDAVAVGMSFSCVLIAGGAQCLGGNEHGQLGDGTNLASLRAVNVAGLDSGVTALAAGADFLCGLTAGGDVRCLGDNRYGQLGNGNTTDAYAAGDVSGLGAGVTAIAAGNDAACALSGDGTLRCWGNNADGLLGSGASTLSTTPVAVNTLATGIAAAAPGDDFSCVLTITGGVSCIGSNAFGQIGNGGTDDARIPHGVKDLSSGVSAVAAGADFACALTAAGAVKCWGNNANGQLGNGTTELSRVPADVSGLGSGVRAIAAGVGFACAVADGGGVQCWGSNRSGQLGAGARTVASTPVTVTGLASGATALGTGPDFACALTTAGTVRCWGSNAYGQLGDGSTAGSLQPVTVKGLEGVTALAVGYDYACALDTAGGVHCWGRNDRGQLGDGSQDNSAVPVTVTGLGGAVTAITAGHFTTCALIVTGAIQCWGDGTYGELGNGTTAGAVTPTAVTGLGGTATAIAASMTRNTVCAVVAAALRCWGDHGPLSGAAVADYSSVPVTLTGFNDGVAALTVGAHHACIVNQIGGVQCWGSDARGQLGDGGMLTRSSVDDGAASTPLAVTVAGLSGVRAVAAGGDFSCALIDTGQVRCWGGNDHGQLGNGTTVDSAQPVTVKGVSDATAVVAGGDFACALTAAGHVLCWGNNVSGQLGTRTAESYPGSSLAVAVM